MQSNDNAIFQFIVNHIISTRILMHLYIKALAKYPSFVMSEILYPELFYIIWTLLQIGNGLYRTYYVDNNNIILNAFCCRSIAVYLYEGHAIHQHKYISRCLIPNTMLYNICQIQSNLIDEKSFFRYFQLL